MIYVRPDQLTQVEYLIQQSIQGNHVLFEPETIKRVLARTERTKARISETEAYSVEHHIERMLEHPTLEAKRAYLESLDSETYERVVLTYFNIVENNLFENLSERSTREGEVLH